MIITGIYKLTSPSNKVYVGSATNIIKRWEKDYKNLNCKGQPKLYNSIKKHNWNSFKKEILEEIYNVDKKELKRLLLERETHYKQIELDKVNGDWSKVLFCDLHDGNTGGPRSEITKQKIRIGNKGKHNYTKTEAFKKLISGIHKGTKKSDEAKQKMSEAKTGDKHFYKKSPRKKSSSYAQAQSLVKINEPIICYDLKGNIIGDFLNASDAKSKLEMTCLTGDIFANCRGKQLTCNGYIFQFKNNNKILEILNRISNDKFRHNNQKIYQRDLNDILIKVHNSTFEAIKFIGRTKGASDINSCCKGKQKTAFNFKWSYN